MSRSSEYRHYMQRIDIPNQNIVDIEDTYPNLQYLKAEGILDIGAAKNVYTEEYADSDNLRYFVPADGTIANKNTTINMVFIVTGPPVDRDATISAFLEYVRTGVHRYWDNARNREFSFVIKDEIKVSDERWHGSSPYVELTIPLTNLNGSTRQH